MFGVCFNQSLERVTLPSGLPRLTVSENFNRGFRQVTCPIGLPTLSFWFLNVGTAWQVILPTSLQMLTLVSTSPKLGASMETFITFSENFNQSLERTTFPQSAANIVNFMHCN